jgi:hypothetical protein
MKKIFILFAWLLVIGSAYAIQSARVKGSVSGTTLQRTDNQTRGYVMLPEGKVNLTIYHPDSSSIVIMMDAKNVATEALKPLVEKILIHEFGKSNLDVRVDTLPGVGSSYIIKAKRK